MRTGRHDETNPASLSCFAKEPQMGNMRYKLEKYFNLISAVSVE